MRTCSSPSATPIPLPARPWRRPPARQKYACQQSLRDLTGELGAAGLRAFHVAFPAGSRTKLHSHSGGQLLVMTAGSGLLQSFERSGGGGGSFGIREAASVPLAEGSVQFVPAGALHAHGADDVGPMSHLAVNHPGPGGPGDYSTEWYESDLAGRVTGRL